jgi:hypothetical protein
MIIDAVDGVPCKIDSETFFADTQIDTREKTNTADFATAKKIRTLQAAGEDFEFYPTTPEIMEAMKKDIWDYLKLHESDYSSRWKSGESVSIKTEYQYTKNGNQKEVEKLNIDSILDIGAGDGRVLDFLNARKKYGIEIARAQADDLIRRGVFIVGRNYWDCSLIDNEYALVFSNPPYSCFEKWVSKILYECNFDLLYLVMPVRWKNQKEIIKELERYEATVVGEFDFSHADRAARGKVNLVRVNAQWEKIDDKNFGIGKRKSQQSLEHAFSRWVREYIADFEEKPHHIRWEEEREKALALKKTPIDQLIDNYEREKESLGAAFRAICNLNPEIIKLMGQDKSSMLEIIRKAIEGLKSKYWRAAFDKIDAVRERMTIDTKRRIFESIEEFRKLDFNADNIYSIAIWLINNVNVGILDQIGAVFDALTDKEYIEIYKSNKHWIKSDWKHNEKNWKYKELPDRWKLDYRIILRTCGSENTVNDFIVVCNNLGFPIKKNCEPNYKLHSESQSFYTTDDELAFTMRYYTGNHNAHLKINKKILMKFNVEVAKIRKWLSTPDDVADEFDITKAEAAKLWNSGLALIGKTDMQMLEYKEAV